MSNFTRANIANGGWSQSGTVGETITATQINNIDINQSKAINGTEGGTYAPTSPIVLNAANCISAIDGSIVLSTSSAAIKRVAKTTAYSQPISAQKLVYPTPGNGWRDNVYPNGANIFAFNSYGYGATLNLHKVGQPFNGSITSVSIYFRIPADAGSGYKTPTVKFYNQMLGGTPVELATLSGTAMYISPSLVSYYTWSYTFSTPLVIEPNKNYFLAVTDDAQNGKEIGIVGWYINASQTDIIPV